MASGLDVQTNQTVSDLKRQDGRWRVVTRENGEAGIFDRIVLAIPPVQALALIGGQSDADPAIERLKSVEIDPCWAVLIGLNQPFEDWPDVMREGTHPVSWIARNGVKPGRPADFEALVVHMSATWSKEHLEEPAGQVERQVLGILQDMTGARFKDPAYLAAHRWRYAKTAVPLGEPMLKLFDGEVLIGGDWCLGARVEAAFESGLAIGEELAKSMQPA